jgi:mono/diheme cytochrome c family protein
VVSLPRSRRRERPQRWCSRSQRQWALSHIGTLSLTLCLAGGAEAQETAPDSARSTMDGVYTEDQAKRGRSIYGLTCQSCHTPASHAGPAFLAAWGGRPIAELYFFIRDNMPQTDPGILSAKEYAQVVAYLLQLNGMPPGPDELPIESSALESIRFDTASPNDSGMRIR